MFKVNNKDIKNNVTGAIVVSLFLLEKHIIASFLALFG